MSIEIFGIIIFLITLPLCYKKENLLLASVFFAPFYECGVISFSSFYLQPGHFFLFLYIGILFVKGYKRKIVNIVKPDLFLSTFLFSAVLSIAVAIVFQINTLSYGIGNGVQLEYSAVDLQNFTQLLYLITGFVLYWLIINYCDSKDRWKKLITIFLLSGIMVLAIGAYQLLAAFYDLPFTVIFRTQHHEMWQQLSRVQSTMGEASFLGQYFTWLLSIVIAGYQWESTIGRMLMISAILSLGVMTRSSTVLIGVFVVFISYGLFQKFSIKMLLKYLACIVAFIVFFSYLYFTNEYVEILVDNTISKIQLNTTSGVQRTEVFEYMFGVGLNYPITGIGYGGGRSTDLYSSIFATTGMFGFVSFFGFIVNCIRKLIFNRDIEGVLVCILLLLGIVVTGISVPEINYLVLWVLFAIIDSKIRLIYPKK